MAQSVAELRAVFTADASQVKRTLSELKSDGERVGKQTGDAIEQGIVSGTRDAGDKAGREIDQSIRARTQATGRVAGEHISKGLSAAGWTGVGAAAGTAVGIGLMGAMSRADAKGMLQAQLGSSSKDAGRYGKVAGDLWKHAWGDSLSDTGDAVRAVVQNVAGMRNASNKELAAVTTNVLALNSAWGESPDAITRAADRLTSSGMAKNATQALDIITYGIQHGANQSEDLLDTFTEYPTQFRKLGITGAQALGLIQQGFQGSARDSDKTADALKEFALRAVNGSKLTAQGFQALGLDAGEMGERVGKGGKTANAALQLTLDRIRDIKDPVKRAQAATALFGTQWEDLGDALLKLDPRKAQESMDKLTGSGKKAADAMSGPTARVTEFKRTLQSDLIDFVDQKVIPAGKKLKDVKHWFDGLPDGAQQTAKWGAGIGLGLAGALITAKKLRDIYGTLQQGASVLTRGKVGGSLLKGAAGAGGSTAEMVVRAGVVNVYGGAGAGRGVVGPGGGGGGGRGGSPGRGGIGWGTVAAAGVAEYFVGKGTNSMVDSASRSRAAGAGGSLSTMGDLEKALKASNVGKYAGDLGINIKKLAYDLSRNGESGKYVKEVQERLSGQSHGFGAALRGAGGAIVPGYTNKTEKAYDAAKNLGAVAGRAVVDPQYLASIRAAKAELGGLPKSVATHITAPGAKVTTQDVAALAQRYNLTPKQVKTLMEATGVDKQQAKVAAYLRNLDLAPNEIATAVSMDTSQGTGKLRAYLRNLGLTPAQVKTTVKTLTSGAQGDMKSVLNRLGIIDRTNATANVRVKADLAGFYTVQRALNSNLDRTAHISVIRSGQPRASGGWISGPGGPRDDKIPALLSNGEYVVNAAAAQRHGRLLEDLNSNRYADGGRIGGPLQFAAGGTVDAAVRLTGISQLDFSKLTRAWLDAAQASMKTAQAAKATTQSRLDDLNAQKQVRDLSAQYGARVNNTAQIRELVKALNARNKKGQLVVTGGAREAKQDQLAAARRSNNTYQVKGLDRAALGTELTKAREDLAALRAQAAAAALSEAGTSVRDKALDRSGIFGTGAITASQLYRNLAKDVVTNDQFAGLVAQLGTAGLSKDLLAQFKTNGPSAQALALGKSILATGNIAQLNQVQTDLTAQATQAGYQTDNLKAPGKGAALVNIERYEANDQTADELAEALYFKANARGL